MRLVAARDITVADLPYISNPFFAKNDVRDAYCGGFTSIHNLNEFVPVQWRNYQQGLDELLKKIDKMEVCLVYSMKLPFLGVVYWQQDPDYPNNPQKGRWVASLSGINQYENLQGIVSSAYSKNMVPQTHSQQRTLSSNVVKAVDNQGLKTAEKHEIKQAKQDKKADETSNKFSYKHNPLENPKATKHIIENEKAVYGFSPNPSSDRIGGFANKIDWANPEQVAKAKARRETYHSKNDNIYKKIEELHNQGASTEEVAREASKIRNQNRLDDYINDPVGLATVHESNLRNYNNTNGPSPEYLYEKYGSWEVVLEKTTNANPGMDACCGLYDKYYNSYNI